MNDTLLTMFATEILDAIDQRVKQSSHIKQTIEENPTEFFLAFSHIAPYSVYIQIMEHIDAIAFNHLMQRLLIQKLTLDDKKEAG